MSLPKDQLLDIESLKQQVGVKREAQQWIQITQDMINAFADVTRDHQFIHVDPVRARETPFGSTVAHGYMTLSLLPPLLEPIILGPENPLMQMNYGINKARFPSPVKVDSRIRASATLKSISFSAQNRLLLAWEVAVDIEGQEKPALVAEVLFMWQVKSVGE
ncbi:MAG: MaoC family dehydratase [Parahaliea sp.]